MYSHCVLDLIFSKFKRFILFCLSYIIIIIHSPLSFVEGSTFVCVVQSIDFHCVLLTLKNWQFDFAQLARDVYAQVPEQTLGRSESKWKRSCQAQNRETNVVGKFQSRVVSVAVFAQEQGEGVGAHVQNYWAPRLRNLIHF